MPRLTLTLVLHNHQPVGNLPEVFRQAFDSAYLPLIDLLERHPQVRCALHYTGPLLEWLEAHEPQFLSRLAALSSREQVELLGGALYEPILAVIPDADKMGQLRAMSDRLEGLFGVRPTGAWLAERVWEPHLPRYLASADLRYTILDQEHFEKAGLAPWETDGAWLTDDVGYSMSVLPASTDLRYLIPWRSVDEVMAYLNEQHAAGRRLIVFGDDGEKLGAWPGTYRLCYEEGWLEQFFQAIEQSQAWLKLSTPGEYLTAARERRPIYIPSASYPEMEDWSLPPSTQEQVRDARKRSDEAGAGARYVRLGHWRGFLVRYAEARLMLQRAIEISRQVHALSDGHRKQEALDHLWRGQCNCPYWHGVFGGIYLYHIRHATFAHLVAADAIADSLSPQTVVAQPGDYDVDGVVEWRLSSAEQSLFIDPAGGHLFEWDLRNEPINLLNTLAPYHESYAAGEQQMSYSSPPLRRAFVDHLLAEPASLEQVVGDSYPEIGHLSSLVHRLEGGADGSNGRIVSRGQGSVIAGTQEVGIAIGKTYEIQAGLRELRVSYTIAGLPSAHQSLTLATEVNLALPPGAHAFGELSASDRSHTLRETADLGQVSDLRLSAGFGRLAVCVRADPPAHILTHPLLSQHRTELGEEQVYQGTRLVLMWGLAAPDAGRWTGQVTLSWEH